MAGNDIETRDHWWWRPGWRPGRSFYTWHFLIDDQPELHEFVARLRPDLDKVAVLDLIPPRWLHMTIQGVGFTDEVSEEDLAAIDIAVAERVAGLGPIQVRLGPVVADAEGVYLPVRPVEAVAGVRTVIREALSEVLGASVLESAEGFHPHISLAYANSNGVPLASIREILAHHRDVVSVALIRVSLIDLNRDDGVYQWRVVLTSELVN